MHACFKAIMDMFITYMINKNTLQKFARKIKILLLLRNFIPINNSLKSLLVFLKTCFQTLNC